jgi:hypothetical protein
MGSELTGICFDSEVHSRCCTVINLSWIGDVLR